MAEAINGDISSHYWASVIIYTFSEAGQALLPFVVYIKAIIKRCMSIQVPGFTEIALSV